jgi:hypothetical protein
VLVFVLLPAIALGVVVAFDVFGSVPRRYVDRFLRRYPIRISVANGPLVVRRLARVRAARTIGGVAGLLLGIAASLLGLHVNLLIAIPIGYLLGAIVAELPSRRDRVEAARPTAMLVPRRLSDYVPRWIVVAPPVIIAVTLAVVLAGALGSQRPSLGDNRALRDALAIGAMMLAAGITLSAARMILHRRQPYTTAELVGADDALRAASLHCVCGGGFAIVAVIASGAIWSVGVVSNVQVLRWIAPWLALTLWLIALFAWSTVRVAPWLVRRPYAATAGPPR